MTTKKFKLTHWNVICDEHGNEISRTQDGPPVIVDKEFLESMEGADEETFKAALTAKATKAALLDAADEVSNHWNDRSTEVNQYEQAQRSARVLRDKAHYIK